jgi:hypothetical protein
MRRIAPPFTPDPIERYDGTRWSGITLGRTRQDEVRKQFKSGRGDYDPAVELVPERPLPYKISVLFATRRKEATAEAVVLKWKEERAGTLLSELVRALGEREAEERFTEGRYEDWRYVLYPERGILLFAIQDRVPLILMGQPERLTRLLRNLPTRATRIINYRDPREDQPKRATYGDYEVRLDMKGMEVENRDRERRNIERDLRDPYESGGRLTYRPGDSGAYRVTITGRYSKDKGGSVEAYVSITAGGPFGEVSASNTESERIERGRDRVYLEDTRYERTLNLARRKAERELISKLERQGPPPISDQRWATWNATVESYRSRTALP